MSLNASAPLLDTSKTMFIARAETTAAHQKAIERVMISMRRQLVEELSLAEMAETAAMSQFHFSRTFHRMTGVPARLFLSYLRLESAKRLLLTTNSSVTDICFDVGYESLGTFIRRFTAVSGVSPRKFRVSSRSLQSALAGLPEMLAKAPQGGIQGALTAPPGFEGPIFIGAFKTRTPEAQPVACCAMKSTGVYNLPQLPDGRYFLMAIGLNRPVNASEYFLYETALRGGGQAITVINGQVYGSIDIQLRPPRPLDLPILSALPILPEFKSSMSAKCQFSAASLANSNMRSLTA